MVSIFIDPFRSIAGFLVIIVVTFKENEDFTINRVVERKCPFTISAAAG